MRSGNYDETGTGRLLQVLVRTGGGILLLILLVIFLGKWFAAAGQDPLAIASHSLAGMSLSSLGSALGAQAQVMDLPLAAGSQAYWYLARAGGVVAYLLLWLATCWGIMMSSKVIKGVVSAPVAYSLHEFLPVLGVVFATLHALALLGDTYIEFSVWQLLVPFTSSYEPVWTGLGTLAFYLFLALIGSFYLRQQIGQKAWRAFHYTAYLAYLIALLHGVMAGSDSGSVAMRALYLVTGGISLFLVYYRMLAYVPKRDGGRTARARE